MHQLVKILLAVQLLFATIYIGQASYEVNLEYAEKGVEDDKMWDWEYIRIRKYNRSTYVMNSVYELKRPFHDGLVVKFEAFNLAGGSTYKKIGEIFEKRPCSRMFEDQYRNIFDDYQNCSSNPVEWKVCPIAPIKNKVTNFLIQDYGLLPPYVPGDEKWRIDVRILEGEEVLGGFNCYITLRSEQSLLNMRG